MRDGDKQITRVIGLLEFGGFEAFARSHSLLFFGGV